MLGQEFSCQGHEVKLITQTPATDQKSFPFEVIRQPQPQELLSLLRWCDVYFHNNISLKTIWPLFTIRRPWVVAHRTWIARLNGSLSWQDHLKRFLLRFATSISISKAVADHLPVSSTVIGNPYRDHLFYEMPAIPRDQELVFVGRLVSDKGVGLLIQAIAQLKQKGLTPKLTVVGTGRELKKLEQQAQDLHIAEQVNFVGTKTGSELVQLLNQHQIMVVPSLWAEPFGIVALEGIACGCVVVGSEGGGLKDAIGPCGITFPNGEVTALTQGLFELLSNPNKLVGYRAKAQEHLSHHTSAEVAKAYLKVIESALNKTKRS